MNLNLSFNQILEEKKLGRPRKNMVKSLIDVAIRKEGVIKKKYGH